MKDLTSGNIKTQLASLALPLILGNILQQFYNTVDALVAGRCLGEAAFAAVGAAGTIMNLFVFIINGFCVGISVILAQFYGCRDLRNFRRESFVSLVSGILFALAVSLLGLAALNPVLAATKTPPEVAACARSYLTIIFSGLWVLFFYNFFSALLRSIGDTRAALLCLAAAVAVNLVLDLVFVGELGMGIAGAAWATLISQFLSVILCVAYIKKKAPGLLMTRKDMNMDQSLLRRTWNYCAVTAVRQSNLYIGKLLVQGTVNPLGTEIMAAYTAAGRIEGFANSFGDSGSAAISIFIAQNQGAGHKKRACQGFVAGMSMSLALGFISSLLMYLAAAGGASIFLGSRSPGYEPCIAYLKTVSCFYIFCFAGNGLAGYFEGRGRMAVTVLGATCHITLRVILCLLFVGRAGLKAVALATGAGWILVVVLWLLIYLKTAQKEG